VQQDILQLQVAVHDVVDVAVVHRADELPKERPRDRLEKGKRRSYTMPKWACWPLEGLQRE